MSDETRWYSCTAVNFGSHSEQIYVLKYYTFLEITLSSRDYEKVPLLLFKIKSSLPGMETSFTYMFTSSAIASVAVS